MTLKKNSFYPERSNSAMNVPQSAGLNLPAFTCIRKHLHVPSDLVNILIIIADVPSGLVNVLDGFVGILNGTGNVLTIKSLFFVLKTSSRPHRSSIIVNNDCKTVVDTIFDKMSASAPRHLKVRTVRGNFCAKMVQFPRHRGKNLIYNV